MGEAIPLGVDDVLEMVERVREYTVGIYRSDKRCCEVGCFTDIFCIMGKFLEAVRAIYLREDARFLLDDTFERGFSFVRRVLHVKKDYAGAIYCCRQEGVHQGH